MKRISKDIEQAIIKYYKLLGTAAIRYKYHISRATLLRIFNRNNVTDRNSIRIKCKNIFSDPRSPTAAYWAGFLMADGCITVKTKGLPVLILNLATADAAHVYAFAKVMGMPAESVKQRSTITKGTVCYKTYVRMSVTPDLQSDLRRYGIVPNKTYNYIEPQVDPSVLRHYLRGWIDGDGTVKLGTNKRRDWTLQVVGNIHAMEWFKRAATSLGFKGVWHEYMRGSGDVYKNILVTLSSEIIQLAHLLTKTLDFKLERKWVGLTESKSFVFQRVQQPKVVRDECIKLLKAGADPKTLSDQFKVKLELIHQWKAINVPERVIRRAIITNDVKTDCMYLLDAGRSPVELAELYNIKVATIRNWVSKLVRAA